MELRLPLEMSPGREAACRAVFGTWGFFRTMHGKTAPSCGLHSQGGVQRGVWASGSYQEGTGKSGSYGMWNHPRGHVWNVLVRPASSWVRPEGREPLPDKAGESTLPSRSGGEKGLRGGGAGKPQGSSRGRPGFRGTLWVASRVPSALSTSNS